MIDKKSEDKQKPIGTSREIINEKAKPFCKEITRSVVDLEKIFKDVNSNKNLPLVFYNLGLINSNYSTVMKILDLYSTSYHHKELKMQARLVADEIEDILNELEATTKDEESVATNKINTISYLVGRFKINFNLLVDTAMEVI